MQCVRWRSMDLQRRISCREAPLFSFRHQTAVNRGRIRPRKNKRAPVTNGGEELNKMTS